MEYPIIPEQRITMIESVDKLFQMFDSYININDLIPTGDYEYYALRFEGYSLWGVYDSKNYIIKSNGEVIEMSNEDLPVGGYPVQVSGMKRIGEKSLRSDGSDAYFIGDVMNKIL